MSGNITRGGTNTRLDPGVTGSRCAKPDPGCPTRLSAKALISSIVDYFTVTVPFTLWVQGLCGEKFLKIATLLIAWLPIGMFLQTSLKILRSFANPHRLNLTRTRFWFQLTYPIPDPTQIFSARSTPKNNSTLPYIPSWRMLRHRGLAKLSKWNHTCSSIMHSLMNLFKS